MSKKNRRPKVTITLDSREDLKDLNTLAAMLDTTLVNACKYSVYFMLKLLQEQGTTGTTPPPDFEPDTFKNEAAETHGLVAGLDGTPLSSTSPLIVHPDDYEVVSDGYSMTGV